MDLQAEEIGHVSRGKEWRWARWSKVRCLWVGMRENLRSLGERRVEHWKARPGNPGAEETEA